MESKEFKAGFAAKNEEFFDELYDAVVPDIKETESIISMDFCKGFIAGVMYPFITPDVDTYDHSVKAYALNFAGNYFKEKAKNADLAFLEEASPNFGVVKIDQDMSQEEIEATIKKTANDLLAKILANKEEKDGSNE